MKKDSVTAAPAGERPATPEPNRFKDVVLATYKVTKGGQISVLKLRPHLKAGPGDHVKITLRAGQLILERAELTDFL